MITFEELVRQDPIEMGRGGHAIDTVLPIAVLLSIYRNSKTVMETDSDSSFDEGTYRGSIFKDSNGVGIHVYAPARKAAEGARHGAEGLVTTIQIHEMYAYGKVPDGLAKTRAVFRELVQYMIECNVASISYHPAHSELQAIHLPQ